MLTLPTSLARLVVFLVLVGALAGSGITQTPAKAGVTPFAYDQTAPLDLRETEVQNIDRISIHDISYVSPKGGRVPAYLVVPQGKGPFAAIEFVHWGQGNRTEFLSEALLYARGGAICLLIDAPSNRPDSQSGPSFMENPERDYQEFVQLVVDIRRGLDVLLARGDVDKTRVAYVGHSLGATWGGTLAGVENRPRVYVLMGGLPNLTDFSGEDSFSKRVREKYSGEQIKNYKAVMGPIDPEVFVRHAAPAHLYFQFARWDRYITRSFAERYVAAASQPKLARFYDTSHEFNDVQSQCDRASWIVTELNLSKGDTAAPCGRIQKLMGHKGRNVQ